MNFFPYWVHKHSSGNVLNIDNNYPSDDHCLSDNIVRKTAMVRQWFFQHKITKKIGTNLKEYLSTI